jgi:hypothetical protein
MKHTVSLQPGVRVVRDSQRAIHHTEAGRVAIPVAVFFADAELAANAEMILPGDDAKYLCDEIVGLLRIETDDATSRPGRDANPRNRRASLQDAAFDAPSA